MKDISCSKWGHTGHKSTILGTDIPINMQNDLNRIHYITFHIKIEEMSNSLCWESICSCKFSKINIVQSTPSFLLNCIEGHSRELELESHTLSFH